MPDDSIDRLAIELHHRHLPELDDAGPVSYDSDAHLVDDVASDLGTQDPVP